MRRKFRAVLVAALAAVLVIDPATACHYCGYYSGYGGPCGGYCEPVSCCGGCDYEYEVVDSGPCGCDDEVVYDGPASDSAPPTMHEPGGEQPRTHSGPANVHRPVDRMPAPQLPAQPTPPQEQPMPEDDGQLSTPSADDLFGPSPAPATKPTDDLFGPTETPATPPADEPPATDEDTLTTDDRYAPPAEPPSEPTGDDLFGPPLDQPAEPKPAEEPMSEPESDDLFGPPPEESTAPADEEPVDEEEPAAPAEEEEDDLFGGFGAILREPGGLASGELRRWVDNSGQYSCRGRLIRVLDGKLQLLKDNGRTTTVPFGRLSQSDLQFVHRQASAQRAEAAGQTAQVGLLRMAQ